MDHLRILGTKPSSVFLSQTTQLKHLKRDAQKVPKLAETNRDGVINPPYYNYKQV